MESHPLLTELLEVCSKHNLDNAKAYNLFQSYIELLEVRKFHSLEHFYNDELKMFYIMGKKEKSDKDAEIYVPVMVEYVINPEELDKWIKVLDPCHEKLNLIIKERDSSSVCYKISKGLAKPDSPLESGRKKEKELNNMKLEKYILSNKKKIYTKSLKNLK